MYIVQIADLHLGSKDNTSRNEKEIIDEGLKKIESLVPKKEKILLCVCGDIIDSAGLESTDIVGAKKRYSIAAELFEEIRRKLEKEYTLTIKFCLGNHDVTHMNEFYEFVSKFDSKVKKEDYEKNFIYAEDDTYYVFVNSCFKNQYKNGCIDYEHLEELLKPLPDGSHKILILHHTIMSMDESDSSSIRDAARLIGIINRNNIVGILHGHIHGRDILSIGNHQCKVIGTGALFSRGNTDVNSQFNLIYFVKGFFKDIYNCRFLADSRNEPENWNTLNIGGINCENYFKGNSFEVIYKSLLNKLAVCSPLYDTVLQINCEYDRFKRELTAFLQNDLLEIGEKQYTYLQLAEMWEDVNVPPELYFNHGSYFKVDEEHGIKLIAKQLKNKPTSNRAVLATYNMKTVVETLDEQKYLPSLSSIQFSKDNEEKDIYVHMHLRALEAGRFLKINICEILWLLKKLEQESIQFTHVNIVISAFRVQIKKKFNCFLKVKIDEMDPMELSAKVNRSRIPEICRMLKEKKDATETITNAQGLTALYKAMGYANSECLREGKKGIYNDELMQKIKHLLEIYSELDKIHLRRSIQTKEEENYDNKIETELSDIIRDFSKLEKAGEGMQL